MPRVTFFLFPNIRETIWCIRLDGALTPLIARKRGKVYVLDTFPFTYGEKPLFKRLGDLRHALTSGQHTDMISSAKVAASRMTL